MGTGFGLGARLVRFPSENFNNADILNQRDVINPNNCANRINTLKQTEQESLTEECNTDFKRRNKRHV